MTPDDLTKPLGLSEKRPRRGRGLLFGAGAVIAVAAAGLAGWYLIGHQQDGQTATAVINTPPPPAAVSPEITASTAPPSGGLTEITPPANDDTTGGKVIIHDPSAPAPIVLSALPQKDLVQKTTDGLLPRVAADGTRPLDAYARPSDTGSGATRIAIVIGGFGIDPKATSQAIETLPGPVTLAFAPYGKTLEKLVSEARQAGHELLLQIPLEPYNYPATDPGPNTLTVNASAAENLSRLHWFMARMTNYVGVVNYMGALFTGDAAAMKPVVADVGARGLLYLDDGSSLRSMAAEVAGTTTPFLRADVVLDADLSPAAIDARLKQLQAIARQRGYAIGTATAFPATIERVAAFVNAAAAKGIKIVPLSALAGDHS